MKPNGPPMLLLTGMARLDRRISACESIGAFCQVFAHCPPFSRSRAMPSDAWFEMNGGTDSRLRGYFEEYSAWVKAE